MAIYSEQKFVHVPVHLPLFLLFFLAQNDLSLGRYMLMMMMMSIITEAISNNPVIVAYTAMPVTKLLLATCTANPKHYNTTLAVHTYTANFKAHMYSHHFVHCFYCPTDYAHPIQIFSFPSSTLS